jgi:iron complex transport system substrate-binding protein
VRIVSLLPSATEILFGIGAGAEVVGVTHECDFPSEARRLPQLTASALPPGDAPGDIDRHVRSSLHAGSSLYYLDSGLLESLAPDLIVTQELCAVCAVSYEIVERAARRLRTDLRVVSLEPSCLDDVLANVTFLGELTGHATGAADLVDALQRRIATLRHRTAGARVRPRTLVLEWTDPPMGGGHWTPGLVELAGGAPVLSQPGGNSQRLEWRQIEHCEPDVVVVTPCGFDLAHARDALVALDSVPQWTGLRAYRERRIFAIDGNAYFNRPGPRLVDSAEILARLLETSSPITSER